MNERAHYSSFLLQSSTTLFASQNNKVERSEKAEKNAHSHIVFTGLPQETQITLHILSIDVDVRDFCTYASGWIQATLMTLKNTSNILISLVDENALFTHFCRWLIEQRLTCYTCCSRFYDQT